jgi:quinol monooxygenase YgiN
MAAMEVYMYIVQVYVNVKQNYVNKFIAATMENARNSILEPGVVRFDVLQEIENPHRFLISEVYTDEQAPLEHKKTYHYKKWKNIVADMMADSRYSVKYENIYPDNNMEW